jgi:hypothetical protein
MKFKILNILIIIALLVILFNLFYSCKEGLTNNDSGSKGPWPGGDITHYWDCCKESCAWSDAAAQVNSCDRTGQSPSKRDDSQKSVCKPDYANITTCAGPRGKGLASRYPWVEGDTLYGFVAGPNHGKAPCGSCYEIELENAGSGVKKAIVQQTSLGNVNGIFDFAVPGGGFGDFNGCSQMKGWQVYTPSGPCDPNNDNDQCTRYGGFHNFDQCTDAFPGDSDAQTACKNVLFGVFPKNAEGVPYRGNLKAKSYKSITCPSKLSSVTGASAPPWTPPPPPTPGQACNADCGDCGWANSGTCTDTSKCGTDLCYTTCCKRKGLDCVDFCSGKKPDPKPPKPTPSGGKGLCKWPNCDGNSGGDWCNTEANCKVCGGSWCPPSKS